MKRRRTALILTSILIATIVFAIGAKRSHTAETTAAARAALHIQAPDTVQEPDTIIPLTDRDFHDVAARLNVDVAAIKAVVEIEAGRTHEGFYAPGRPLINFDLGMFRQYAGKRGVNIAKYSKSHSVVFSSHRGSQQRAHKRLTAARTIHPHAAVEGTFWGMFQIGGFNWKRCGAASIEEFERLMSRSERDQLNLFAEFITSTGLVKHLQNKDWASFARGYNGPSYARRAYHTRMAGAYTRYIAEEQAEATALAAAEAAQEKAIKAKTKATPAKKSKATKRKSRR